MVQDINPGSNLFVFSAFLGFLANILALGGIFFRLGRFEGTVDTRLKHLEDQQAKTPTSEKANNIEENIDRIEAELTQHRKDQASRWDRHEQEHRDQHHWVANALTAVAIEMKINLPPRRRQSDRFGEDPEREGP